MVLNVIWIAFFLIALVVGLVRLIFLHDTEIFTAMVNSTFDMAKTAFEISLGLTGVLTLWLGLMRVGERGGAVDALAKVVRLYACPCLGKRVDQFLQFRLSRSQVRRDARRDDRLSRVRRSLAARVPAPRPPRQKIAQQVARYDGIVQVAEVILQLLDLLDQRVRLVAEDLFKELERVAQSLGRNAQRVQALQRHIWPSHPALVGLYSSEALVDQERGHKTQAVRPGLDPAS